MKTLYVSDLDGTLLNKQAQLDDLAVLQLQKLINENHILFTVATARTAATVGQLLQNVPCNIPAILMNGVCIYDLIKNQYVHCCYLSENAKKYLVDAIHNFNLEGFLYTIENNTLHTYYENASSTSTQEFMQERIKKYKKPFTHTASFTAEVNKPIIYYSISDNLQNLRPAYEYLRLCQELHVEFYKDIYNEDLWYLEVCDKSAGKDKAILWLKQHYKIEKVIAFGDNFNDIPMFTVSDACYAVQNAKDELKQLATDVIKPNTENGVIEFLLNNT